MRPNSTSPLEPRRMTRRGRGSFVAGAWLLWVAVTLWLTTFPYVVRAGGAGTTSAEFLNLGVGARAVAMGEAYTAAGNDANVIAWNPAGLARIEKQEISFTHLEFIEDTRYDWLGYARPISKLGVFGLGFAKLTQSSIQAFDANGKSIGTIGAGDWLGTLSYSKAIGERLSLGVSSKYIRSTLSGISATAFGADIGILYIAPRKIADGDLRVGAAVQNVGTKMKFQSESFSLPTTVRGGVSYTRDLLSSPITLAVEEVKPLKTGLYTAAGLEYIYSRIFALRGGFTTKEKIAKTWRVGMGFIFKVSNTDLHVDYAFLPQSDLGNTHRISFRLRFGSIIHPSPFIRHIFDQGMDNFSKGRFAEAILYFTQVLERYPEHKLAMDMIQKATKSIKELRKLRKLRKGKNLPVEQ